VIQVANFQERDAGMRFMKLGSERAIMEEQNIAVGADLFLFGGILLVGLYHFLLFFLLKRKEKSYLYVGILCVVVAARTILMGTRLLHFILSSFDSYAYLLLEYLTVPLITVFFSAFFLSYLRYRWFKGLHISISALSLVYIGFLFLTPLAVSGNVLSIYQFIILIFGIILLVTIVAAVLKRKEGALILLSGFLIFFITAVNDVLNYNRIILTFYMIPWGVFFFIMFQAGSLAVTLTKAFQSVEKLSRRLTILDKLKDAVLANTSHEIRTPLVGIIGIAESILEGTTGRVNEELARKMHIIISGSRRLSNLLNDILDFSQLKYKELVINKKAVNMFKLCHTVFLFSRPLLMGKDIALENKIPKDFPLVLGDPGRLQQILHNLIDNAIKFTEKGTISVSAFKMGTTAYFSVEDTGRGIPEDKLDLIFESFEQVDPERDSAAGGKGFGLSITKQLIELHGGTIDVHSEEGKGSSFTFSLPVHPVQEEMEEETIEPFSAQLIEEQSPKNGELIELETALAGPRKEAGVLLKILAVDDEPMNLEVLHDFLTPASYEVTTVSSGEKALGLITAEKYDLVLLDLLMPELSGFDVCKKIREQYAPHELPVIIVTARNTVEDFIKAIQYGANDFIAKPFSKAELIMRVRTHVQLSKLNVAYRRFIPERFLELLGKESVIEVVPGDQIQRVMSILFCDIRAFAAFSEDMAPREIFAFLNSYFEKIAPIIREYGGFIDKYIGDEIMALFPDDPEDALKCALKIKKAVDTYNTFRSKVGYVPVHIGIGVHTGTMMLGTIGDNTRIEGTVISDVVNAASRIEGLTKLYGGSIIISASIFYTLKNPSLYRYRFLGLVQVKGKRQTLSIYEIFDDSPEGDLKQKFKDDFEKGLQLYYKKDFKEASRIFKDILDQNQVDKAARLYYNRAEENKYKVLPDDWDGVETLFYK
jgi:two-component system sensor histidine kinase ChiS